MLTSRVRYCGSLFVLVWCIVHLVLSAGMSDAPSCSFFATLPLLAVARHMFQLSRMPKCVSLCYPDMVFLSLAFILSFIHAHIGRSLFLTQLHACGRRGRSLRARSSGRRRGASALGMPSSGDFGVPYKSQPQKDTHNKRHRSLGLVFKTTTANHQWLPGRFAMQLPANADVT